MEFPQITVIVLTYKAFDGLWITLESICKQDYPNIELIISNDGCSEFSNLESRISEFVEKHKSENMKHVMIQGLEHNVGTVKHANLCIKKASGEYIKLLSPDDYFIHDHALATLYEAITREQGLILASQAKYYDPQTHQIYRIAPSTKDMAVYSAMTAKQQYTYLLEGGRPVNTPAVFFSMELFHKYGYFNERYRLIEDYPYYIEITKAGEKIRYLPEITVMYACNGMSSHRQNTPADINGNPIVNQFKKEQRQFIEDLLNSCTACSKQYLRLLHHMYEQERKYAEHFYFNMPEYKKFLLRLRYWDFYAWRAYKKVKLLCFYIKKRCSH